MQRIPQPLLDTSEAVPAHHRGQRAVEIRTVCDNVQPRRDHLLDVDGNLGACYLIGHPRAKPCLHDPGSLVHLRDLKPLIGLAEERRPTTGQGVDLHPVQAVPATQELADPTTLTARPTPRPTPAAT